MRAFIEHIPWSRQYAIRLVQESGLVAHVAADIDQDHRVVWQEISEREEMPVLLSLDERVFKALAREIGNYTESSDATVRHLNDATATRDRIFTLLERVLP